MPCQTFMMEGFAKIVNGFQSFTIFAKGSVLDVYRALNSPLTLYCHRRCFGVFLKENLHGRVLQYCCLQSGISLSHFSQVPVVFRNIKWDYWPETLHKKMKFSIKDFFSKCNQIRSFPWIWSHLLKKSLMKNFIFCAVK